MKYEFKILLTFLLIMTFFSCSEKKVEEEIIKADPVIVEITCLVKKISAQDENYFLKFDEIKFSKSENLEISIVNEKIEIAEEQISDSARIVMQTLNYDEFGNHKFNESVEIELFNSLFSNSEYERYKHIPFKIKIVDDQIISIKEIYIP